MDSAVLPLTREHAKECVLNRTRHPRVWLCLVRFMVKPILYDLPRVIHLVPGTSSRKREHPAWTLRFLTVYYNTAVKMIARASRCE